MPSTPRAVLLTGPARSGTTLACELLNDVPDTVALDEPLTGRELLGRVGRRRMLLGAARPAVAPRLERWVAHARARALADGEVMTCHVHGRVTGERKTAPTEGGGRSDRAVRGVVAIDRPLTPHFGLVIKHVAAFLGVLDELVPRFEVVAIVRNPLTTLASWDTLGELGWARGRSPLAERLRPGLARRLAAVEDIDARKVELLAWCFEQLAVLPNESIVRYEDIVATGGRALSPAVAGAADLDRPLTLADPIERYGRERVGRIARTLLASDGEFWRYYDRDAVQAET